LLIYRYILIYLFTCCALQLNATHNRAGEITYVQKGQFTYEITITTFTNTRPTSGGWPPADRPVLEIDFGDDNVAQVQRSEMYDLPDYYRKNIYVITHTFPGPGTYELVVEDPNRNEGVANIPNSVTVVFSIKTIMQINPSLGINNTPQLLSPPVDKAAKNRLFIHNPAAWDPDGDSLAYRLTSCTGEDGQPINGFTFPENITMNELTGDLIWNKPTEVGIFNVAILIEEWREGVKIGQITRDLQIEVYETENMPPDMLSLQEICVEAGEVIEIQIKAFDPNGDNIELTPLGGAFELNDPAQFEVLSQSNDTTVAHVYWETNCSHVRRQPYLLVIKAEDTDSDIVLADLHYIQIWVNGPTSQFTSITSGNTNIELSWTSTGCGETGYELFRSVQSQAWDFDVCQTGIPVGTSYKLVAELDQDVQVYLDTNDGIGLPQGYQYFYRVVPLFDDAKGYVSNEVSATLVRGIPVITNVSVEQSSVNDGEIYLAWSRPTEIDPIEHPGPYSYKVYRSTGLYGQSFSDEPIVELFELNDTVYQDVGLNTKELGYSYKVELHNQDGLVSQPMVASSIHLRASGADEQVFLEPEINVSWINETYYYYEVQEGTEVELSVQDSSTFLHKDLINGETYQYRLKSEGQYYEDGFVKPIVNYSQITSASPIDTIPPAPPQVSVGSNCDIFENTIEWQASSNEVAVVEVYYASKNNATLQLIADFTYPDTTSFTHKPDIGVGGCYALKAVDFSGNMSEFSTKVCIDSCDIYKLPNVITLNGDDLNEVFRPFGDEDAILNTVLKADVKIFSRWGNLVYETNDPLINWNGENKQTNKWVSTGVYYYIINLTEHRISGPEERYVVGFIHVYTYK
jgi:gliding motility-associated-like protein